MPDAGTRLEKAWLRIVAPFSPGGGGMLEGLGGALGGSALGGMGASGGAALGAAADSLLGTGGGGGSSLGELTFQFNPKEYQVQKSANWVSSPQPNAAQAAIPQFQGAGPRSISLEVFLDDASGINDKVELLFRCVTPTAQSLTGGGAASPPFVIFGWGSTVSVHAFVKQVSARYTMFKGDGTPTRATCQLQLEEIPTPAAGTNPTSGGASARRTHTVIAGDTLHSIAWREYRNPALWRALASVNEIDDPMHLPTGTRLLIPAPAEARQYL